MKSARRLPRAFFIPVILLLLSLAPHASAQQARGNLRGLVTDELGAAIVGANVTLTDATGVQKKTTTNGEGIYTFAGLTPGSYKLQAIAPGFTHLRRANSRRQGRTPIAGRHAQGHDRRAGHGRGNTDQHRSE